MKCASFEVDLTPLRSAPWFDSIQYYCEWSQQGLQGHGYKIYMTEEGVPNKEVLQTLDECNLPYLSTQGGWMCFNVYALIQLPDVSVD